MAFGSEGAVSPSPVPSTRLGLVDRRGLYMYLSIMYVTYSQLELWKISISSDQALAAGLRSCNGQIECISHVHKINPHRDLSGTCKTSALQFPRAPMQENQVRASDIQRLKDIPPHVDIKEHYIVAGSEYRVLSSSTSRRTPQALQSRARESTSGRPRSCTSSRSGAR